ncbi:MAG: 3-deoxy-7-phosphoheptulonate synthase [Actinomycetota bacterium]|jgi:3-deoxy-7-phosphoheptulonate synthase|nr:MAG: 3-deoxy-7-phosphoheptulonate synthase [Actinomycetota bacterium]
MVVVMKQDAGEAEIEAVCEKVRAVGGEAFVSRGTVHTVIGLVGDTERFEAIPFGQLPGVDHVIRIGKPYKMVSADLHPSPSTVKVGPAVIGRETFTLIAGPCAVESYEQALTATQAAKRAGATILRGDVFKPRTSPYSFQGLGEQGLEILDACRRETGLPIVVEVVDVSHVQHVAEVADCIRVGTRNAQNFELLKECGLARKPVMLKRGLAMTVDEWLQAAEYVAQRGNADVILCERGIRTFEPSTRNTLDLAGMAVAQRESHLPVIVDPSHAVGKRALVGPMALAAVAAGADAVMIDVHPDPEHALCDGPQALVPDEVVALGERLAAVARAVGRELASEAEPGAR